MQQVKSSAHIVCLLDFYKSLVCPGFLVRVGMPFLRELYNISSAIKELEPVADLVV